MPIVKALPGEPASAAPGKAALAAATAAERKTLAGGALAATAGAAGTVLKSTGVPLDQAAPVPLPPLVGHALLGLGAVVLIAAVIALVRKRTAIAASWF